jgi:hypothetical protein
MYELDLLLKNYCNITPYIYYYACISCNKESILDLNIKHHNYKNIQWCSHCNKERHVYFYHQKYKN